MIRYLRDNVKLATGLFFNAGIMLGVGFVWPVFWWLVFPGIALFILAIAKAESVRAAFWGGWLVGTVKLMFSISWFFTTYPIRWIDLALGWFELPVIGFYWASASLVIGFSFALLALLCKLACQHIPKWWLFVVLALWVPAEILGAGLFSVLGYGTGGSLNLLFTYGMAGYHLAENSLLLQFARLGGAYALSFLAVLIGVILYFLLQQKNLAQGGQWAAIIMAVLVGSGFLAGETSNLNQGIPVAIVDTKFGGADFLSFSHEEREKIRREVMLVASETALAKETKYVVMNENSRFTDPRLGPQRSFAQWREFAPETQAIVVDTGNVVTGLREWALRASVYDPSTNTGWVADKQFLVPQGEYMPYFYLTLLHLLGLGEAADAIAAKLIYRPGPYVSQANFPKHIPGILFCFEEAHPLAVRRLVNERQLPFIANPVSHAWFNNPQSLWVQRDAMLKIQAVWNQVPIVTAGNMVTGAVYTPQGEKIIPEVVATGDLFVVRKITL